MKYLSKNAFSRFIFCFLVFTLLICSTSCKNYFLVTEFPNNNIITGLDNLEKSNSQKVVHHQNLTYNLNEVQIDSTSLSGILSLSTNEFNYRLHEWNHQYKTSDRQKINTSHIFLKYNYPKLSPGFVQFETKDLTKIDVVKKDKKKTTISYLIGLGSIALWFGIMSAVVPSVGLYYWGY